MLLGGRKLKSMIEKPRLSEQIVSRNMGVKDSASEGLAGSEEHGKKTYIFLENT